MTKTSGLQIGDLVVFQSTSIAVKKNQIGIVVNTTIENVFDEECFSGVVWYVVQFGTMRLVVSNQMVQKIA